ncbi:Rha family transcriptional regulator [Providencia rustigianii]|uniref:Rha family transcriptional regulator n=1 Tax=Providencia rustigianii TaxID=158850 RepID=UPI0038B3DB7C
MKSPAMAVTAINPNVSIHNGKAITTTEDVAIYFGKQHHHVVQKLESLDCSKEFTIRNFSRMVKYKSIGSGAKREVVYYEMTKDGFVFLVMGFTGKKAAQFKEAYIAEFNRMEAELYGNKITSDITQEEKEAYNINVLAKHFDVIHQSWKNELYPILRKLESPIAGHLYDSFQYCGVFIKNLQQSLNSKLTSNQTPRLY